MYIFLLIVKFGFSCKYDDLENEIKILYIPVKRVNEKIDKFIQNIFETHKENLDDFMVINLIRFG